MAKSQWYIENEKSITTAKKTLIEASFSNTAVESETLNHIKEAFIILMNRVAYLESILPDDKK